MLSVQIAAVRMGPVACKLDEAEVGMMTKDGLMTTVTVFFRTEGKTKQNVQSKLSSMKISHKHLFNMLQTRT